MTSPNSSTDPEQPGHLDAYLPGGSRPAPAPGPDPDQPHPVDQIALRKLGGFNFITPAQWSALEREERKRLLKSGEVTFLYQGREIPVRAALLFLRG